MGKETKGTNAVTTTFAKFGDAKRHNYETLPTIDVEILPDVRHCEKCDAEMVWDPKGGYLGMGAWAHADATIDHGWAAPKTRCRYCHSEDDAVYRQHAWYDAVECSRCGGVDGHAIGD